MWRAEDNTFGESASKISISHGPFKVIHLVN